MESHRERFSILFGIAKRCAESLSFRVEVVFLLLAKEI